MSSHRCGSVWVLATIVASTWLAAQSPPGNRDIDHTSLVWRDEPQLATRAYAAFAYDERRDRLVLFGGYGGGGHSIATGEQSETWEFDGRSWRRRSIDGPPARQGHAMAWDPVRERVLVFGGQTTKASGGAVLHADTWEWDGEQWHELQPAHRPPARWGTAIATDPVRKRVVLFGGFVTQGIFGGVSDETWEWDGSDWIQQTPAAAPAARGGAAMAWCANSARIVLYGGGDSGGVAGDTWEWDGSQWVERRGASGPPPAGQHGLASDRGSGGVLMFGGTGMRSAWYWSGSAWSPTSGVQPPTRDPSLLSVGPERRIWYGAFALDVHTWEWTLANGWQQRVFEPLFYGGEAAYDAARDETVFVRSTIALYTTVRTEAGYRNMQPPVSPPNRTNFGLVYHAGRRQVLLYGGSGKDDLWAWDGATWREIPVSGPRPPPNSATVHVAYDTARDKLVVVPYLFENELWEWDANGWQKSIPSPPHAATSTCLGYDVGRRKLVLFGLMRGGEQRVWEYERGGWTQESDQGPNVCFVSYVPFLSGIVGLSARQQEGRQLWQRAHVWDGERWNDVPSIELQAGFAGPLVYDAARQRLWSFRGPYWGPDAWYLERRTLEAPPYVRPGETLTFDFDLPEAGYDFAVLAFARATYPGIPLIEEPGLGWKRLPLAFDDLLRSSLSAPIVLRLNGLGRRQYAFEVPDVPAFVGLRFFAAAVTLRASSGFGSITNVVDLEIGR
jgi:hypothetical protein